MISIKLKGLPGKGKEKTQNRSISFLFCKEHKSNNFDP